MNPEHITTLGTSGIMISYKHPSCKHQKRSGFPEHIVFHLQAGKSCHKEDLLGESGVSSPLLRRLGGS